MHALVLSVIVTVSYVSSCYGFTLEMLIGGFYREPSSVCMEQFFLLDDNVTLFSFSTIHFLICTTDTMSLLIFVL